MEPARLTTSITEGVDASAPYGEHQQRQEDHAMTASAHPAELPITGYLDRFSVINPFIWAHMR